MAVGYNVHEDGSVRVAFAAPGDVGLDGKVDVFDLLAISSGGQFGTGLPAAWDEGDFNYDGVANVFDLVGVGAAGAYGRGDYTVSFAALRDASAVPEPAFWTEVITIGLVVSRPGRSRSRRCS